MRESKETWKEIAWRATMSSENVEEKVEKIDENPKWMMQNIANRLRQLFSYNSFTMWNFRKISEKSLCLPMNST